MGALIIGGFWLVIEGGKTPLVNVSYGNCSLFDWKDLSEVVAFAILLSVNSADFFLTNIAQAEFCRCICFSFYFKIVAIRLVEISFCWFLFWISLDTPMNVAARGVFAKLLVRFLSWSLSTRFLVSPLLNLLSLVYVYCFERSVWLSYLLVYCTTGIA